MKRLEQIEDEITIKSLENKRDNILLYMQKESIENIREIRDDYLICICKLGDLKRDYRNKYNTDYNKK